MKRINKGLTILLVVAVVASIGGIVYLANMPKPGDRFTEFYTLGLGGKTDNYPKVIAVDEPAGILLGIVNHEGKPTSYRVTLTIEGNLEQEVHTGMLSNGAVWEEKVYFTARQLGKKQRLELNLYKDSSDQPYHKEPLQLFIDVIPK